MANHKPLTLKQYYVSFKSVCGAFAVLFSASPFLSKLLPDAPSSYIFPPLGDVEPFARVGLVLLALLATFGVYYWEKDASVNTGKLIAVALGIAVLSVCAYIALHISFVRRIDIPTLNRDVYVSVGYQRTEFANATFGTASDEELLRARGTDDEQVRLLWTGTTVTIARIALYLAWLLFVLSLVATFSLGVLNEALQRAHE